MFSGQLIGLMSAWFRLYVNHVQSLCNAISHIFGVHDSVHSHSLFNVSHTKISRLKVPRTSRDHLGRLCLGNSPRSWRSIDMVCLHHVHNPIGETAQECGQAIRAWKNRSGGSALYMLSLSFRNWQRRSFYSIQPGGDSLHGLHAAFAVS
jgi:hypothetical protein